MHIEIKQGSPVVGRSGTSKNGKVFQLREQEGWLHSGGEVRRIRLTINMEQMVYDVGLYDLDDASYTTSDYGDVRIARVVLRKRAASAVKAA